MVECMKKHIITIVAVSLVVIAAVVTTVVLVLKNKDDDNKEKNSTSSDLTILLNDSQMKKPNIKLNAEFELVKMGNGMTGVIINDPYADKSLIQFSMKYGSYIDTIPGISHFGEHMVLQSSERFRGLYPLFNKYMGIKNAAIDAGTSGTDQVYFVTLPFNLLFEGALDVFTDAFRYPLYEPEIIKNEIQAVNHEFYFRLNSMNLREDLMRQLSSNKTSFNGMICGNNQTLKPNESEILSKKLKGYHMVVKNPKNIFFTLYSNKSIKESEEYAKKYLNYAMHIFQKEEIDEEDKKKLEQNIKDIESIEIFDENIYKHGIYFNMYYQLNILLIHYYIGKIDYKELKLNIIDYFSYLLKSNSLLDILKKKNYLESDKISFDGEVLDNNNYFIAYLFLTDKGLKNINDILLIFNKYFDIMKNEGYKRDYYNNYIKYMNNQKILSFTKNSYMNLGSYIQMHFNYLYFEQDKILLSGDFTEENYNEDILKKYLNNINYNKSFYILNTRNKSTELTHLNDVLDNVKKEKYKYYDIDFMVGTYPASLDQNVTNNTIIFEELKMRKINEYFSSKYKEPVVPCYKEERNTCLKKNEFDYNTEDNYTGTQLMDEKNASYNTYYQIDKSSESHLVYSYLEFSLSMQGITNELLLTIEKNYMKYIISELLEIQETFEYKFSDKKLIFIFRTFSDNTEKIINKFLDLMSDTPTENNFNFSKILAISSIYQEKSQNFRSYVLGIVAKLLQNKEEVNYDQIIDNIEQTDYTTFKNFYNKFLENFSKVNFKIVGNINETLVQNIHNHIKEKIIIADSFTFKMEKLKVDESYVKNYYLKSTLNEPENGIVVAYIIPQDKIKYITIFQECLQKIAFKYLRFNYTNAYTPLISMEENILRIFEQGLYKEVDKMEDDIDSVLLDIIEGKIEIENQNYNLIVNSYFNTNDEVEKEKTLDNLFQDFITRNETQNTFLNDEDFPKNFSKLVEMVKPVLINPQRISLLIARNTLSDTDYENMYNNRIGQFTKYKLNNNIIINYTKLNN